MASPRLIRFHEEAARDAFAAHAALLKAEAADPALSRNPFWTMLRQDAYEAFARAFERQ